MNMKRSDLSAEKGRVCNGRFKIYLMLYKRTAG